MGLPKKLKKNTISTAVIFLDIEKAFDNISHSDLLNKLTKFEFSTNLIKLSGSFLTLQKFGVPVEGGMSTPRDM
jgi:retron-type reverse transcriptase